MSPRECLMQAIAGVFTYYGKELSEFLLRVWLDDLEGYDVEAVERALVRHRRDPERGRFMPFTADILRQLNGDSEERALVAWGNVIEAARKGGGAFEGPTQDALDAIGGMARLRFAPERDNGFIQREFCAAFRAFRARDDRRLLEVAAPAPVLACQPRTARP